MLNNFYCLGFTFYASESAYYLGITFYASESAFSFSVNQKYLITIQRFYFVNPEIF